MNRYRWLLAASIMLVPMAAGPVAAQTDDAGVVEITGVEYAFQDVPATLTSGASLSFRNDGLEVHELVLFRVDDDVTATLAELLAMGDPEAMGLVERVGELPLFAAPGGVADDFVTLEREGRYAVVCLIPQGLTDIGPLLEFGPDTDPADLPAELQAIMSNPPHAMLGMAAEFVVTPAGETPADELSAGESSSPEG